MKVLEIIKEKFIIEQNKDTTNHKALFVIGGPGSGKSELVRKVVGAVGLRPIDPDKFFELHLKKQKQEMDISDKYSEEIYKAFSDSLSHAENLLFSYIMRGVGVIIDTTGRNYSSTMRIKNILEDYGYDTSMVFVKSSVDDAVERNSKRDRKLNTDKIRKTHQQVDKNIGAYEYMFDADFYIIENNKDFDEIQFNKLINRLRR